MILCYSLGSGKYSSRHVVSFDSEEEVRSQMEINFYGPLRTVRAILPSMRAKGSGNIVLISSGAG